jgi:outer membrane protein
MTKKSLFTRTVLVAGAFLLVASGFEAAQAAAPTSGAAPIARILMVDLRRVMATSKVGRDIERQVIDLKKRAQSELQGEGQALQRDRAALEQQAAILAPDVKARKAREFDARVAAFQRKLQQRSGLIQGGVLRAQQQIEQSLGPILQGVMQERRATVLLDRSAVLLAPNAIDVTGDVVRRLDIKMSSVTVELTALPQSMQQQQQQQAAQEE